MAADNRKLAPRRAQAGMSLIEVLVALVIFSIGVLGLVGLQARATQLSIDAEDRTRAALLANELAAQMWASRTTSLPDAVLTAWRSRLEDVSTAGLPNAKADIGAPDAQGVVTITISWRSPSKQRADAASSYVTKVVLP